MARYIGFLTFYLTIYGGFHLYLLIKARRAFYLQGIPYLVWLVLLLFLLTAPLQARVLENHGYDVLSVMSAWVGYIWMATLFIFVCLSIPLDLYHLIMGVIRRLADVDLTSLTLARRQAFNFTAATTLLILLYGIGEAHYIRTETVTLHSPKIPEAVGRVRIVQISDVHVGPMMTPSRLSALLSAVKKAEPDLLVSTGDLIDGQVSDPADVIHLLSSMPARLGKFAVTGNHEYYAGIQQAAAMTEKGGFTLLRGKIASLGNFLSIAGLDDPAGGSGGPDQEAALLSGQPPGDRFTILLKHRPLITDDDPPLFDLQLSGHTHNGQIFPFGMVVRMQYPLTSGLHRVGERGHLYVSRGSGTWGPPVRFLAAPEVTVIDLLPARQ